MSKSGMIWQRVENAENISVLLHPFAKFTSLLSGDELTTLLCVIPAIMDVNIHLAEDGNLLLVCCCLYYCVTYYTPGRGKIVPHNVIN